MKKWQYTAVSTQGTTFKLQSPGSELKLDDNLGVIRGEDRYPSLLIGYDNVNIHIVTQYILFFPLEKVG